MFIETSAKAGHNVKTLFKRIAQALPGMEDRGNEPNTPTSKSFPLSCQALLLGSKQSYLGNTYSSSLFSPPSDRRQHQPQPTHHPRWAMCLLAIQLHATHRHHYYREPTHQEPQTTTNHVQGEKIRNFTKRMNQLTLCYFIVLDEMFVLI